MFRVTVRLASNLAEFGSFLALYIRLLGQARRAPRNHCCYYNFCNSALTFARITIATAEVPFSIFWHADSKFADGRLKLAVRHVPGRKAGQIMLYALSTCGWCKKTKQLLDDLGVEYDYEYVDLLSGEERTNTLKTVEKWNQKLSFPTLTINDKCIVGFKENEIRDALKL